jgi:anti-sigma regulatory factor (Ser/Thr protein kinase)
LDESTPGGLGLHLVRNLAEAVHYHRENGKNLLEIRIALQSE